MGRAEPAIAAGTEAAAARKEMNEKRTRILGNAKLNLQWKK